MSRKPIENSICFDYSHNNTLTIESPSYADFTQFLFGSSFQLGKIQAGLDPNKLEKYQMLVIGGARESKFSEDDIAIIVNFVKNGGNLLVINDEGGDYGSNCNLSNLTEFFGFSYNSDILFDSVNFQNIQSRLIVSNIEPHPITQNIDAIVISSGCSITIHDWVDKEEEIDIYPLAKSSLNTYRTQWTGKKWGQEEDAPQSIVAVAADFFKGKVIGLTTVSFFSSLSTSYGYFALNNKEFISNIFNWLVESRAESDKKFKDYKLLSLKIKISLFLWMEKLVADKKWRNIEEITNFALKYFKKNYLEIIESRPTPVKKTTVPEKEKQEIIKTISQKSKISSDKPALSEISTMDDFSDEKIKDLAKIMEDLNQVTQGAIGSDFNIEKFKEEYLTPKQKAELNKQENKKQEESSSTQEDSCLTFDELEHGDEEVLKAQLKNHEIKPSCEDEDLKEVQKISRELKEEEKTTDKDIVEDSSSKQESKKEKNTNSLKARADAALDEALKSLDSFDEFQKKLNEFKNLSDSDDPIK